ncbi:mechanosensitive ion channel family protein [Hydrogenivirga sp.]
MERFYIKLLIALGLLVGSFFVASFLKGRVYSLRRRFGEDKLSVIALLANAVYLVSIALGTLTSLGVLGVDLSALVTGLGLTGFAVGFALKDIISNLLAGILIILYSPFRVGDRIRVGSYEGVVLEINLRYTVIEGDGERILVPNATMFTNIISVKQG